MSSEKEALATDLGIDGIQAWGQLYDTVSSKLEFDMVFPGRYAQNIADVATPLAAG